MQMYKREIKYKGDYYDLEIVYDSCCKIMFYLLSARFWKLLES